MPDEKQDAVASTILEEIEDAARRCRAFARSQAGLARLAAEARAEMGRGEVFDFDPASTPE